MNKNVRTCLHNAPITPNSPHTEQAFKTQCSVQHSEANNALLDRTAESRQAPTAAEPVCAQGRGVCPRQDPDDKQRHRLAKREHNRRLPMSGACFNVCGNLDTKQFWQSQQTHQFEQAIQPHGRARCKPDFLNASIADKPKHKK